jgi:hypothetical protein
MVSQNIIRVRSHLTALVFAAAAVASLAPRATAQVADGLLDDEVTAFMADNNGNNIPDILERPGPPGLLYVEIDTFLDGSFVPGVDGFRDAGLRNPDIFNCETCLQPLGGPPSIRSPFNTGRVFIIYLPDPEGDVDPNDFAGTDQSLLYVGMDIYSGDARAVTGPLAPNSIPLDIVDADGDGDICNDGALDLAPQDGIADVFGVPFDVDADGNPQTLALWNAYPVCDPSPSLREDFAERYGIALLACAEVINPGPNNEVVVGDAIGDFDLTVERNDTLISLSAFDRAFIASPGRAQTSGRATPDELIQDIINNIQTYPAAGTLTTDLIGQGPRDVEFVIEHIDSLVDLAFPASPYEIDRFRFANGGFQTFSDSDGDSAAEDRVYGLWDLPIPEIEAIKEVRCADSGDPNWGTSVEALPGSDVEFRITVKNVGNRNLAVQLDDVLESFNGASFTVDTTSLVATLFPNDPNAINPGIPLTAGNAQTGGRNFNPNFFTPGPLGFLTGVANGESRYLGELNGLQVCDDPIVLGDRVELVFTATINAADPPCNTLVDGRNSINVTADPDIPGPFGPLPAPNGNEVFDFAGTVPLDPANGVDTPDEFKQGFDDNVVDINVLCRDVDFQKDIQFCPSCVSIPGLCQAFTDTAIIPDLPPGQFPICIRYRYQVTNTGEVPEEITISDPLLCADVAAIAGLHVVDDDPNNCLICSGPVVATLNPGESLNPPAYCALQFDSPAALEAFLIRDDNALDPNYPRPCPVLPPPGVDNPKCYSNCAEVLVDATDLGDICDTVEPFTRYDDATLCRRDCDVEVTKSVECLDCPSGQPITSVNGDPLPVLPGSCLRYSLLIENTSTDGVNICRLELTDTLAAAVGNVGDCIVVDLSSVTIIVPGGTCPVPAGFNVNGNPFIIDLVDGACMGRSLQPGETVLVRFEATIPATASADCDPLNTIVIRGEADEEDGSCTGIFSCESMSEVAVDVQNLEVRCEKEWKATWDSNADCQPGPGCLPNPNDCDEYTDNLDLREAVFPVDLTLRVTAYNDGEVPVDVTPSDATLCNCVNSTPGVTFQGPCELCLGTAKTISPGGSAEWICTIRVATAAAMRALAVCDGGSFDDQFENTATINAELNGIGICPGEGDMSDCSATILVPPPCDISVTKEVKCVDDPDADYADLAEALPGARLTYRIQITNENEFVKVPRLCLTDVLTCNSWLVNDSIAADIAGDDVTDCVAPKFLTGLQNGTRQCVWFGNFGGQTACRPADPWLADWDGVPPGETLTITFDVIVPADFNDGAGPNCAPGTATDCTNTITVEAFSEVCVPAGQPDTPCDTEDAAADINVLVPEVECIKEVCIEVAPGDCVAADDFDTEALADCAAFPLTIVYRYGARNIGELPLTNVEVCDAELIADALAAGLTVNMAECGLCTGNCDNTDDQCAALADLPNCGDETPLVECRITVPDFNAWIAFRELDDDGDPNTYTNNAIVTAEVDVTLVPDICTTGSELTVTSENECRARVRVEPPCNIAVTKYQRCLEACPNGDPIGDFSGDPLQVVPGTTIEYFFEVENVNNPPYAEDICRIRITDELTGNIDKNDTEFVPCVVVNQFDQVQCTIPQCFKTDGNPYDVEFDTLCSDPLRPGWKLRATFVRCNVQDGPDIVNNVTVEGAPCRPGGEEPVYCCMADDEVTAEVGLPSIVCTKEWQAKWDSDADCEPGPACLPDPTDCNVFTSNLDLSEAVFPVELTLKVTATNDGEVPLRVWASDLFFCNCVLTTPGVSFIDTPCEVCVFPTDPTYAQEIPADPTMPAIWTCRVRIDNAEAMRSLATCDGTFDLLYENTVTVYGEPICPGTPVEAMCPAEIIAPPPCELDITKEVICLADCNDPDSGIGTPGETLDIAPGTCAQFIITVTNNSTEVKLPRLCITDNIMPVARRAWFQLGSCVADIDGDDVTGCVCSQFNVLNQERCVTFNCRAGDPWIAPGETLTLRFAVEVPANFEVVGEDPDLVNMITVEGHTEACAQPSSQEDPCIDMDEAELNVVAPSIICEKTLEIDYGNDGFIDVARTDVANISQSLQPADFPVAVTYYWDVSNLGEVVLNNVELCDLQLVIDVPASGATFDACSLDSVTGCVNLGSLFPTDMVTTSCTILFADEDQILAFMDADGAGEDPPCYQNFTTVTAEPDFSGVCSANGAVDVTHVCDAIVCFPQAFCPPLVKAMFDIWNENEIGFSGTERCIWSWDDRTLSSYTFDNGMPNHFLRQNLQTNRGYARIDGVNSDVVCGPDSVPAPLLGVKADYLEIDAYKAIAGKALHGSGRQPGKIIVRDETPVDNSVPNYSNTVSGENSGSIVGRFATRSTQLDPDITAIPPGNQRVNTVQPGSLLVYPKVEIRWNAAGELIQDTYITLTNDGDNDIRIQAYLVNGDASMCNLNDATFTLTENQSVSWSALNGDPEVIQPFTILDPVGIPDNDPWNVGGTVLQGYLVFWAINPNGEEIRWNHLTGNATVVLYSEFTAWEYSAYSFQALAAEEGQSLLAPFGQLDLDGVEYSDLPNRLLLPFVAIDATLSTGPGLDLHLLDTVLTLWAAEQDFRER